MLETETALSRREATLRSAATVCLAGITLVQAIELPSLFVQGKQFGALSMAAMAVCLALAVAVTMAPAHAAGPVWRLVAAATVVVLAASALPHALTVPGLEEARGDWASPPGIVCAALAVACLVVAGVAGRRARPAARALATALVVLATVGPGVWVALVALGPGAAGGEQSLAADHVHGHAGHSAPVVAEAIEYRPGSGREGGHYVVSVAPPARHTALGLGLVVAAALAFTAAAVAHLRRRSGAGLRPGLEGGPA